MKIIHTSDLHIGHMLYGYDRSEDHEHMLRQLTELVENEQPDALLISGDVYDTSQPSARAQRLFVSAISRMHAKSQHTAIIITAGNHDSASRHEIFRDPWLTQGITVTGLLTDYEPEKAIIEIHGKGYVIALPYINRGIDREKVQQLIDYVAERNTDNLPIVIMAHTAIIGSDVTGHDVWDEKIVGSIESCEIEVLGKGYDYAALGHIHRRQIVRGSAGKACYSGSPLGISFDEEADHSAEIVEIDGHGKQASIRRHILQPITPLITLPITGYTTWEDALNALEEFPDNLRAYIRLNVEQKDPLPPDYAIMAQRVTERKECRFCTCNYRPMPSNNDPNSPNQNEMTVDQFVDADPMTIARMYAKVCGQSFGDEEEDMMKEVLEHLNASHNA